MARLHKRFAMGSDGIWMGGHPNRTFHGHLSLILYQGNTDWKSDVCCGIEDGGLHLRGSDPLVQRLKPRVIRWWLHSWQLKPIEPGNHEGIAFDDFAEPREPRLLRCCATGQASGDPVKHTPFFSCTRPKIDEAGREIFGLLLRPRPALHPLQHGGL